jgi:CheY-like chemotaxis protein
LRYSFFLNRSRELKALRENRFVEKTVLIVDDENQAREFVSAVMVENGYLPMTAGNGQEAMDMITRKRPDLIILDVLMPRQGGIKMYRQLKSSDSLRDIPVVIFSGIARRTFLRSQAGSEETEGAGIPAPDGYIEKPVTPDHLAAVVRDILDKKRH